MKKNFKTAITLGVAICGLVMQVACQAQSTTSNPDNAATPQSANAVPQSNDAVIKELVEMKARIAQLESELKASGASSTSVTPVATVTAPTAPAATPAPQRSAPRELPKKRHSPATGPG
jgi:hypothetical protein